MLDQVATAAARLSLALLLLLMLGAAAGCSDDDGPAGVADGGGGGADGSADGASPADSAASRKLVFGGSRPARLRVPSGYRAGKAYPLVVVLHGFGANGFYQETYLGYWALQKQREMFLIAPDGTKNLEGKLYWNASPACCWRNSGPEVDDVKYLGDLVAEIRASYNIDAKRIYFVGHSNGGYMSYRMACDRPDLVAGIVSLAGASRQRDKCKPSSAVSVLQVHGDLDDAVRIGGGGAGETAYPGAKEALGYWAGYNGCTGTLKLDSANKLDLEKLAGDETTVERYDGCPKSIGLELWTMVGVGHVPFFSTTTVFAEKTFDWLMAHPKP